VTRGTYQKETNVTTVDVYIEKTGSRDILVLRNGLTGPATTVFHAVIDACQDGTATGQWGGSHAEATISGRNLRPILAKIGTLEPPFHQPADNDRLAAFRQSITDDADYDITAIEV
jgi:hypothetical protein